MPLIVGTLPIKLSALEFLEHHSSVFGASSAMQLVDKGSQDFTEMRPVRGLTARDNRRLEIAAQAVIASARWSDNSTGINWRRLRTTSISEHYLTEYPGLPNQEIALRETLEEVERRVIEHELDLDRIDNPELQERIEDVLNDILDFMVHDAQASSSDGDSSTDSSGSDDSDDASESDYPPNITHNSGSDAVHQAHQHQQRFHHEAGHASESSSSRASSQFQGPHLPPDVVHPISVAEEHIPSSNTSARIVEEPQQPQNGVQDESRDRRERGILSCCSTM